MQAFIDANAVEEGRQRQEQIWQDMWTEIGDELAKLPAEIVTTVMSAPGKILEGVTGIPMWVWALGSVTIVVALGYGVWRILMTAAPAVAPVAAQLAMKRLGV